MLPEECAYAVIDGDGMNTKALLEGLLGQFGYDVDFDTNNELLAMLRVFAQQQAALHEPPIVIIENTHALNPSALRVLCDLAKLRVRQICALKLVLVSDRSLHSIIDAPAMECISRRLTADFHLRPMTCAETGTYLHSKLEAAGSEIPSFVFPTSVCNEMWKASAGWPGILDRIALLALARAETLPVREADVEKPALPSGTWDAQTIEAAERDTGAPAAPPVLILTERGKEPKKLTFEKPRILIGRSEHNDLSIDSRFVSRHHMLLVRNGSSTFLMDLNSTNGTFVNSRRVSNHVLIDDDVITVGHHSIKFCDPHAKQRGTLDGAEFADTAIMKTLEEMRNLLAQENTAILPAQSENTPTLGSKAPGP
ncbi:MAG: FHA domain-containing protein [Proteobacteria bacterium]|nr:FHA domain-containing protein [Pseudomonadota bacterium]